VLPGSSGPGPWGPGKTGRLRHTAPSLTAVSSGPYEESSAVGGWLVGLAHGCGPDLSPCPGLDKGFGGVAPPPYGAAPPLYAARVRALGGAPAVVTGGL